jgi:hypothetical protein
MKEGRGTSETSSWGFVSSCLEEEEKKTASSFSPSPLLPFSPSTSLSLSLRTPHARRAAG